MATDPVDRNEEDAPDEDVNEGPDDADEGAEDGPDGVDSDEGDGGEGAGSGDDARDGADREDDADGADAGQEDRPHQVSRGGRRISSLRERTRVAEETAAEARRDAAEARRLVTEAEARANARTTQESEAQERARLADMLPEERYDYLRQKDRRDLDNQLGAMRFQMGDQADKTAFEARAETNPTYKRYAAKVETKLQEMRRSGQNVSREALLKFMIGEDALKNGSRVSTKQRKGAQARMARETTRPGNGRSDTGSNARGNVRRGNTPADRLKDVAI